MKPMKPKDRKLRIRSGDWRYLNHTASKYRQGLWPDSKFDLSDDQWWGDRKALTKFTVAFESADGPFPTSYLWREGQEESKLLGHIGYENYNRYYKKYDKYKERRKNEVMLQAKEHLKTCLVSYSCCY